jgi:hydrogenase expression/formation protein HypE
MAVSATNAARPGATFRPRREHAQASRPQAGYPDGLVDLSHGAGGRATAQLIDEIFREAFDNPFLNQGNDQAAFDVPAGRMVMSTDGYVIWPLFFPGGDIGSLAVHGTINDLAMAGARPLHLAASYIIEEGFPLADLQRIATAWGAPRAKRA